MLSLVGYLLYPVAGMLGVSKGALTGFVTIPVVLLVWLGVRRIRRVVEQSGPDL